MKIALVVQDLIGGGVEYATAAMARAFCERGFAVDLLVSRCQQDYMAAGKAPFAVPSAVNVIAMPSRSGRENVPFVRRYLKTTDAVCVVAESGIYADCLFLASLGIRKRPRLAQVWHGDTPRSDYSFRELMQRKIHYWFLYRQIDCLLTVNEHIREGVLQLTSALTPDRVMTVYNPVIDGAFYAKRVCPTTHPWLVKKTCPTFVAAGVCDKNKGHGMLLRAMRLANETRRIRLVIFGTGVEEENFRRYIRENHLEDVVSLAGFTNNLPAELKSADGFVLGTHVESFAIVLVEAMACGVPVISTAAPWGPVEVLENGKYGTLVPVDDVEAMAREMVNLAEHRPAPVPDEAWKRFTVEAVTDRYLKGLGLPLVAHD